MKTLLLLTAYCLPLTVFSQPVIQWEKTFGGSSFDFARFQQKTSDGGYVTVGYSNSTDGDVTTNYGSFDMWAVKFDSLGTIQWQKSIGGNGFDLAWNVSQTLDKGFILSGFTDSNDTLISGNHGMTDVLIVKLDSAGNVKWKKVYGGSNDDGNIESGILPMKDGSYMVTANTFSNDGDVSGNHGSGDFWVFKIDSVGNLKWQKCLGGSSDEDSHTIVPTNDGGFVIAGHSDSNDGDVGTTKGLDDEWIVKIDSVGNIKWSKTFGGSNDDVAFYLTQTSDSGYAVIGYTNSNDGDVTNNHGGMDEWLIKLDSAGNLKWQKTFGGSSGDYGTRILTSPDNGFVLAGYSNSTDGDVTGNHGSFDYWILKTDSIGNLQWENSFGGSGLDDAYALSPAYNGYVISGYTNSNDGDISGNHGAMDIWSLRICIKPAANFISDTSVCLNDSIQFINLSVNSNQWNWNFGDANSSSAFSPSHVYAAAGNYTVTLVASNGTCTDTIKKKVTVNVLPVSSFADTTNGDTAYFTNNSLAACYYTWNFGDGNNSSAQNPIHTYSANGTYSVCLTVYSCDSCQSIFCKDVSILVLGTNEAEQNSFSIRPTLFTDGITISSSFKKEIEVAVYDLLSREVYSKKIAEPKSEEYLPLGNLDRGVYLLKISSSEKIISYKIIKE
ncbi:MAG: PKD domain-containing protein [Bacteroidetes bacterium]|nr:PKD domain-containing protein [Bacteroidota bacterium]